MNVLNQINLRLKDYPWFLCIEHDDDRFIIYVKSGGMFEKNILNIIMLDYDTNFIIRKVL